MTATAYEKQRVFIVDDNTDRSRRLAETTELKIIDAESALKEVRFTLQWVNNTLSLRDHTSRKPLDVSIDFTGGQAQHRKKFGGGHGQPIARAVKTRDHPHICDATAGFGKDAFIFASLGCKVTLLENSVVVHALLSDAIKRAANHDNTREAVSRMQLFHSDSTQLPKNWPHADPPDIVYLDPMYPDGKRTAKKEIQTLRQLLAPQKTDILLLEAARKTAQRVVVKRPRNAHPLEGIAPSGNINSPNTRYDIYGA